MPRVGTQDNLMNKIAPRLSRSEPVQRVPGETAAVAIIFDRTGSFLLIKRAERPDDPWSGHVAFPGGRVETSDMSFLQTASRESLEEVGLELSTRARFLGYMESFKARTQDVLVIPCVFVLRQEGVVVQNREVYSHRWVPFASVSAGSRDQYFLERGGTRLAMPAFRFGDYLVWGLTERILTRLAELGGVGV